MPLDASSDADASSRLVLDLVDQVPAGRATTYGDLARFASDLGPARVTARMVGRIMATAERDVPWWRVVGHDGRLPPGLCEQALERLSEDGCPLRGDRVDLRRARWSP